ncbi:MAG: hypothetical protein ACRDY7_13110 [Acidimicrobiia bacterium]
MAGVLSGRTRLRLVALAACVAGVALLAGGFAGLLRAQVLPARVPYLASGGLGGLAVLAVGITWLVSAESQSDQDRLTRVEEAIRARGATAPGPSRAAEEASL